jgi:hypothetical protein
MTIIVYKLVLQRGQAQYSPCAVTHEEVEQRMDELAREFYEENPRRDLQATLPAKVGSLIR